MIETERRFLVKNNNWTNTYTEKKAIIQGYLNEDYKKLVRVRLEYVLNKNNHIAYLTIKGEKKKGSGLEFEVEIPIDDAEKILELCEHIVSKNRYIIPTNDNLKWEVDDFLGLSSELIIAEIELKDINQHFDKPDWLGEEITNNHSYSNISIAQFGI